MKKALNVLFVFLTLLSMAGIACAAECSDDNQTIMRLYNPGTNTHGAIWDQTGYTVTICYNTIFGAKYSSPTDPAPHDCTLDADGKITNGVISLTGVTNAHASSLLTATTSYPRIVCHKGLKDCNTICTGDKEPIVYLSSITNAHLSKTAAAGYPITICCKNTTGGGIPPRPPPTQPTQCQHYDNISDYPPYQGKDNCNNDATDLKIAQTTDIMCPFSGSDKAKCYCWWDDTQTVVGKRCVLSWNNQIGACSYRCTRTVTSEGICNDATGMKSVVLDAKVVPLTAAQCPATAPDCLSGAVEAPCGFITADLPFFGAGQFALSIVAVLFAYLLLNKHIKKRQYS